MREEEKVEVLVHRKVERLEAPAALQAQPRVEMPAHVDAFVVAPLEEALEPPPLQGKALLALEVDLARIERLVGLLPLGRNVCDLDLQHGLSAQTVHFTDLA